MLLPCTDSRLCLCSMGVCGRFYHVSCAKRLPQLQMAKKGSHFFCPQHYCRACGQSGDGKDMVRTTAQQMPAVCASCVCVGARAQVSAALAGFPSRASLQQCSIYGCTSG